MIKQKRLPFGHIITYLLLLVLSVGLFPGPARAGSTADSYNFTAQAVQALQNNYALYQQGQAVDGAWGNFSAYDACILQSAGADVSKWVYNGTSFKDQVISLADATIINEKSAQKSSAKNVAQEYMAARCIGDANRADDLLKILNDRQAETSDGSFDDNPFSDIPALEMLGRAGDINKIDETKSLSYVLGQQDAASGSWGSTWAGIFYPDFMSTAEAIRDLKYMEPDAKDQAQTQEIEAAITKGCDWLKTMQKDDGSFQNSWDDSAVDTSEAIYTLKLLGIDPAGWTNSGKSALDYLQNDVMNADGTLGAGNVASNTWVLDACLQLGAKLGAAGDENSLLGVVLSPVTASLTVGKTRQFTAKACTLDGAAKDVTDDVYCAWSVADTKVAKVDSGLVTGLQPGNTQVTAVYKGLKASSGLTVSSDTGGGSQNNTINVSITIIGKNDTVISEAKNVSLTSNSKYGLTPVGALNATGISWSVAPNFSDLVYEIAGQQNEGTNGWMYEVNGVTPAVSAFDYQVQAGDEVIWRYSTDASSLKNSDTESTSAKNEEIKESLAAYDDTFTQLDSKTLAVNNDNKMSAEQARTLQKELADNTVALSADVDQNEAVLADPQQEVTLFIPEKGLTQAKTITVQELSSAAWPQQSGFKIASSVYDFGPNGTNFDKPVTIAFKAAISGDMDADSLNPAWYDEKTGQWVTIPGIIDLEKGLVVFKTDHFTRFALVEKTTLLTVPEVPPVIKKVSFADVGDQYYWAKDAIEIMAGEGILKGTGSGFEPARPITRAEFVELIKNSLSLKEEEDTGTFKDVSPSAWFADAVSAVCKNNLVSGYPDGTFKPGNTISRYEVAVILQKLMPANSTANKTGLSFQDQAGFPGWARLGVQSAYQAGLMQGYADGTFKGEQPLTRAEAAVLICKYLNTYANKVSEQ